MDVRVRRVQDPPLPDDGLRVLVERYWRGSTAIARVDRWERELAPSPRLLAWYGRRPERWEEFQSRYAAELRRPEVAAMLAELRAQAETGSLTLLYRGHDREHNPAAALARAAGWQYREPARQPGVILVAQPAVLSTTGALRLDFAPLGFVLDWAWLLLGLAAPIVAFVALNVMLAFGTRGLEGGLAALLLLCGATYLRVWLRERRYPPDAIPHDREGRQPIWVGLWNLVTVGIGVSLGIGALCLIVVLFALRAGALS